MRVLKEYRKGSKVKVSKNFNSSEFDCKCKDPNCQVTLIDSEHLENLQALRDSLGQPITINSSYRCEKWNKQVGGATHSRHVKGDATDITVKNMTPEEVAEKCEHFQGLGLYDSFTHIDIEDWKGDLERFREHPNDKHLLESIVRRIKNSDPELLLEIKKHLEEELTEEPNSNIVALEYYRNL